MAERGVVRYLAGVGPFVRQLTGPGGLDWAALSAADVTRFVIDVCSDSEKKPSSCLLAALRSFLRFAQLEGWIGLPLTQAVPSGGWVEWRFVAAQA